MLTIHQPTKTSGRPPQQTSVIAAGAKVCHVLHSLNVGGAEVLAARIARRLSDRFEFTFACLDDLGTLGRQLRHEGFTVEVIQRRPGLDMSCARRLSRFVRSQGVQVLHVHQYTPFFYAMLSGLLRRRPPVLFTEHGRWHPDYPSRKRMLFNRLLLRRRDRVVGVGESVRQALIDNEGIPARRVEVVYNGVEMSDYDYDEGRRHAVRRELEIDPSDPVLIQVARLDALKDHGTALRTVARLAESRPNVRLLLVGEGPEQDTIEAEIERLGIEANVRLLGLRDDVARLLGAADVFLLSSVSEGIPVTLIEAMMARVPIVSTNVGGVAEVVADGTTGLLAPSGYDEALAEAVGRLLDDEAMRTRMSEQGQERAERLFSEQQMHASYASLYRESVSE